jgi:hypothetical protein
MDQQDRGFLKDEYLKLQDQYEDFDRRSLTIKGWVSAGAAIAIVTGLKADGRFAIPQWIAIASFALTFWYLEARWKQFQYALAGRIRELERYFRDGTPEPKPLQIYQNWFDHYRRATGRSTLWGAARQDFVMLPYVVIVAVCLAGIALDLAGR